MSGGSKKAETVQQQATIPDELKPLVNQQAAVGGGALGRLQSMLQGAGANQLIAGFDPLQAQAQQQAIDIAGGAGGFFPVAQDALMGTARGDFLFGGQGFDQAVDAAVRAAQPHLFSTFGGAGRGGGSGLLQTAIAQQATDAFASQFGQERQHQLAAARALPQLGLIPSDILAQIGGQRQALAQRQLVAPMSAQEALIQAAGGGVPLGSLMGMTQTSSGGSGGTSGLGAGLTSGLGGASAGFTIGGPVGAAIGGGLGFLGGLLS